MVLEITPETGKTTTDNEMTNLRGLLQDMEEEGLVDTKLKDHNLERPGASAGHEGHRQPLHKDKQKGHGILDHCAYYCIIHGSSCWVWR